MPSGLGVQEAILESRGLRDSEHQGQRRSDNLREVLGCPRPLKWPNGPSPKGAARRGASPVTPPVPAFPSTPQYKSCL